MLSITEIKLLRLYIKRKPNNMPTKIPIKVTINPCVKNIKTICLLLAPRVKRIQISLSFDLTVITTVDKTNIDATAIIKNNIKLINNFSNLIASNKVP